MDVKPQFEIPSGAAMDRRVLRSKRGRWKLVGALAAVVGLIGVVRWAMPSGLRVAGTDVQLATVTKGLFRDEIAMRARVEPLNSILLDSIEGGRVEEVLVLDGQQVEKGALLFRLSNPQRNLDLLARQAEHAQQIANRSTLRETQEARRTDYMRRITELEFALGKARKELARYEELAAKHFLSEASLEASRDQIAQYERQLAEENQRHRTETEVARLALMQLDEAVVRLQHGLTLVNATLDGLAVRAPSDGRLTGFKLQVGQTVTLGQRIGRIDDPNRFKLSAQVDEFYLGRVDEGRPGAIRVDGREFPVAVSAIYPQVKEGRFTVELTFAKDQPAALNPGQSLELRITLGESSPALLLPNGRFANDTGGNWVFVVDGGVAQRRKIAVGRRSGTQIEIKSGLAVGEQVVVSSYTAFGDAQRLVLGK